MHIDTILELAKEKLQFASSEAAEAQLKPVDGVGYICYNPELRGVGYLFGNDGGMLAFGGMTSSEAAVEAYIAGRRSE